MMHVGPAVPVVIAKRGLPGVFWTMGSEGKGELRYCMGNQMDMHIHTHAYNSVSGEICRHTPDKDKTTCHFIMQIIPDARRVEEESKGVHGQTVFQKMASSCCIMFPASKRKETVPIFICKAGVNKIQAGARESQECYMICVSRHASHYNVRKKNAVRMMVCLKGCQFLYVRNEPGITIEEMHRRVFHSNFNLVAMAAENILIVQLTIAVVDAAKTHTPFLIGSLYEKVPPLCSAAYVCFLRDRLEQSQITETESLESTEPGKTKTKEAQFLQHTVTVPRNSSFECSVAAEGECMPLNNSNQNVLDISMYTDEEINYVMRLGLEFQTL